MKLPTAQQLKAAAEKEALLLHKHTTKEERSFLDADDFNPTKSTQCIYGLLTSSCYSERAKKLQKKCAAAPFFSDAKYGSSIVKSIIGGYTQLEHYIYNADKEEAMRILNIVKFGK